MLLLHVYICRLYDYTKIKNADIVEYFSRSDKLNMHVQYSQRHSATIQHDRHIIHPSDLDISFVLFNISSKFLLHLECYLLAPKRHTRISKWIKQTKRYVSITKTSDTPTTAIHYVMYLTVPYIHHLCLQLYYQHCQKY